MSYCSKINKDVTGAIELLNTDDLEHKLTDCEQHCNRYYQCDSIAQMQDELKYRQGEILKCPHCEHYQEHCDCPDLFYKDIRNTRLIDEQYDLLLELNDNGFNVVTCGHCGQVFIHRT